MRKISEYIAWCGFVEGQPHLIDPPDNYEVPAEQLAIYRTRKSVRARYQDVRRVTIRVERR